MTSQSPSEDSILENASPSEDSFLSSTGSPQKKGSRSKMMKMLGVSGEVVDRSLIMQATRKAQSDDNLKSKMMKKIALPADYTFSKEDCPQNIEFENGTLVVRAGTVEKLVERLTTAEDLDPNYPFEFLLTYRSFTSPQELLRLLQERYNMPTPEEVAKDESDTESWQQHVVKPIRLRVFNVLKKWVEEHWYDFEEHQHLVEDLKKFADETMSKAGMDKLGQNLTKTINRKIEGTQKGETIVFSKPAPDSYEPDIKQLAGTPSHLAFLVFHSEEIARQLTLIEFDLFKSIKPWECIGQAWAKKEKEHKAPNILGMIQRFNKVSMWVKSTVVHIENVKTRAEAISKFIEVGDRLKAMNNFNGLMELIAGLQSAAVRRLKKSWALISSKHMKQFEEIIDFMTPYSNYSKLRNHLHKEIEPPCIPYLGVYLTDLTFIEDGNPDCTAEHDLINFDKRRRIAAVIKEIKQYQQMPYNFHTVSILKGYLLAGGEYVDENECFKLSQILEPKEEESARKSSVGAKSRLASLASLKRVGSKKNIKADGESRSRSTSSAENNDSNVKLSQSSPDLKSLISDDGRKSSDSLGKWVNASIAKSDSTSSMPAISPSSDLSPIDASPILSESPSFEDDAPVDIPFDKLVGYLESGDNEAFERYFGSLDIYQAENIRTQAVRMWKEKSPSPQ